MQNPRIARRLATLAAAGALALGAVAATPVHALDPNTDGAVVAGQDTGSAIVQLSAAPLATSTAVDKQRNGKVDLAGAKTKSVAAQLVAQRNAFRQWLKSNAPKAKITGEFDFALNAVSVKLNGTPLATLAAAPGVTAAQYEKVYTPQAVADPDLAIINAVQAWKASGFSVSDSDPKDWAGYGVKVGVIDTGIDATHPCFDDTGFPKTTQLGDTRYTNNKVIAARVFNNRIQQNKVTPEAVQEHGTHVAGTIGCNLLTPAAVDGVTIPYDPSGVAPGVQLGNYNVFPAQIESARSADIFQAMQAAAQDGMDVLNMSLGGGAKGTNDLESQAVNNLDRAGIVVAVANGNDGPGYFTAGSPGTAERALTAGAASVGHFVGLTITGEGVSATAATGDFGVPEAAVTAPLKIVTDAGALTKGCAAFETDAYKDAIAVISRGSCTFSNKAFNAEKAGAKAVIVVNNVAGDPSSMAADPSYPTTIPAVMVGLGDKQQLVENDGTSVTIDPALSYFRHPENDNILAGFSSWGPTTVDLQIKPDVVAPGVNVLSSIPLSYCKDETVGCWAFFNGTSMATPHLAGMAAVVRDVHPTWAAWQIRSAIVNTAVQDGVLDTATGTTPETDVMKVGSGLADLEASVAAIVALDRPSVSFGAVPKGSAAGRTQQVTVTNLTDASKELAVSVGEQQGPGRFTVDRSSVTLPANGSATLTITYAHPAGTKSGSFSQAHLHLGDAAHAALWAMAK